MSDYAGPFVFMRKHLQTMLAEEPCDQTTVAEVNRYTIRTRAGWSIGVPDEALKVLPGSAVTIWGEGKGLGSSLRGLVVGNIFCRYRTPPQEEVHHQRWVAERTREKEEELERVRPALDAEFAWLPELFRQRLIRFRTNNPDFRRDFEVYEMFCIREAIRIVGHFNHKYPDAPGEAYQRWLQLSHDGNNKWIQQGQRWANRELMLDEGHSGNTHSMALLLARCWLEQPWLIPEMHGAMSPLTGCLDYGCHTKEDFPDKEVTHA